jgi:hypothetical protein
MRKPLFSTGALAHTTPVEISTGFSKSKPAKTSCIDLTELNNIIAHVEHGSLLSYINKAKFSAHNILLTLLTLTGPAQVYLASWAISEKPVRDILNALADGRITELHCLFDADVRNKNPKAYQLAEHNFKNMGHAKTHAKVIVIINDSWAISVSSSQNLSNNMRWEQGTILENRETALMYSQWITNQIENYTR